MRPLQYLFLLSCLAPISGCQIAVPQCPPPGWPSAAHQSCFYVLKVKNVDDIKNQVLATDHSGKDFTFRVHDVEMLKRTNQLEENKEYVFSSVSNSPYLELFPEAVQKEIRNEVQY